MIGIVNYGMGNIKSVQNALAFFGVENAVVHTRTEILKSDKLILPGVGSFAQAMKNINALGIIDALNHFVLELNKPIMGICLGMQLLADVGEEDGPTSGFGWIPGKVVKFNLNDGFKIPHIGFNSINIRPGSTLFNHLKNNSDFYFVHSYVLNCESEADVTSWTDYGGKFISSVNRKNIFGTQFHPEKSQSNGLKVLKNFIEK